MGAVQLIVVLLYVFYLLRISYKLTAHCPTNCWYFNFS